MDFMKLLARVMLVIVLIFFAGAGLILFVGAHFISPMGIENIILRLVIGLAMIVIGVSGLVKFQSPEEKVGEIMAAITVVVVTLYLVVCGGVLMVTAYTADIPLITAIGQFIGGFLLSSISLSGLIYLGNKL